MKKYLFLFFLLLGTCSEAVITRLSALFGALAAGSATGVGVYFGNKPGQYYVDKEKLEKKALKYGAIAGGVTGLASLAYLARKTPGVVFRGVQKALLDVDGQYITRVIKSKPNFQEVINATDGYFIHSETPRIALFEALSLSFSELQEAQQKVNELRGHIPEQELDKYTEKISGLNDQISATIVQLRNTPDWLQSVQTAKSKEAAEEARKAKQWAQANTALTAWHHLTSDHNRYDRHDK